MRGRRGIEQEELQAEPRLAGRQRSQDPRIGSVVDKYVLVRLLGKGGMGAVYEARHQQLSRRFAIKFLLPRFADEPRALRRFEAEARIAGGLEHSNVAAVMDMGQAEDGSRYFVMEYLEGEDCAELIRRAGPLAPKRAVNLILQACRGVAAAHAAGVVHRDIKPENLFIARSGSGEDWVKVLDFGIAKLRQPLGDGLTRTGSTLGTALYMSPEQAKGSSRIDERSDVWSLGVVLYELLSGKRPFGGRQFLQIANQILHQQATPLSELCPQLPAALVQVVDRALRKPLSERYPTVLAFADALGAIEELDAALPADASERRVAAVSPVHAPLPATASLIESMTVRDGGGEPPRTEIAPSQPKPAPARTLDLLELHAERRRAGVPTVSVLCGPLAATRARFGQWAARTGASVNTAHCGDPVDPLGQWLATSESRGLRAHAARVVAAAAEVSPALVTSLSDVRSRDTEIVFERAAQTGERQALACWVLGHRTRPAREAVQAFGGLVQDLEGETWLALVDTASDEALAQVRLIARLAEEFPRLSIALAMTEAVAEQVLGDGRLRWQTLLLEGVIPVPGGATVPVPEGLPAATRRARMELMERGASAVTLQEFDAIALGKGVGAPRSRAEEFLFSLLADHAETVGWFVLNRKLGFKFGRRAAEVDICSERLGIAIEVDGHYHQTPQAQARDRKKDELLRQNGYTVLRVEISELSRGLTGVIDRILFTVRERKRAIWEV